jgi:hypothetical protein
MDLTNEPVQQLAGVWRSIIIDNPRLLDGTLTDLAKQGLQAIQVSPIPRKITIGDSEPSEKWKGEDAEESGALMATSLLIIYVQPVLKEAWLARVHRGVKEIDKL